ncbi:hypothetical protein Y032_0030g2221 [Ancylostoma ceylanicum]|uniref:7TM chemoreceptor n=2 Tax=Ancylostoma ceylanicum TaxID=53326 RepID=A0A016UR81_9BILA|nr:hypothetical protein Y032_0030g2221 [Ancylostoma ceylanicum]
MTPCDDFNLHPPIYCTIMSILSVMTLPVNILAIYCITRKSTRQMGPYKWFLLAYQSTSTTFDFSLTIVVLPVVFFPIPMGYADSMIARWLSLRTHVALCTIVITVAVLTTCIVALFLYRLHVVIPHNHFLNFGCRAYISPDQSEARKWVLTEYPCAELFVDAPRLHMYTGPSMTHLVAVGLGKGFIVTNIILCVIFLSFYFLGKNNHLSQRTKFMQKRFLIYLCVQAAVPTFSLLGPVILILSSGASQLRQDLGSLIFFYSMAAHGFTSPLSVILCNDAYRASAVTFLKLNFVREKQIGIASASEQIGRQS